MYLNEDKRSQLLSASRSAEKEKDGKTRFQKRVKSKVKSNVSNLNKVNFNQFFKDNIMTVNLDVVGETNEYVVTISFGGALDEIHRELKKANNILNLKVVIRALLNSFNSDNVYIRCSCEDFKYRFSYWLSKNKVIAGELENRPSDKTNPNNTLGRGCKHIMLVLSNTSWIIKLASVVYNYINYMEKHYKKLYADLIYPKIYEKEYEEPVQLDIDTKDQDELDTSTDTIDKSNIYARDKGKFKVGNKQGVRFAPKTDNRNISIFDLEDADQEEEEV